MPAKLSLPVVLAAALALAACGGGSSRAPTAPEPGNLVERLGEVPGLERFAEAVEKAGLQSRLEAGGPYTVFAPSNAAFDRLTPGAFETMLKPELLVQLRTLVESHIVEDEVGFTDLAGEETTLTTLAGGDITVDAVDTIRVDDALMVESDLAASNGLIHVIDHILQPAQPAISEDSVEELEPLDQDAGDQDAGTSPGA
jgi:uncharacterized surface protein with fasciclin (FAS1) repeats